MNGTHVTTSRWVNNRKPLGLRPCGSSRLMRYCYFGAAITGSCYDVTLRVEKYVMHNSLQCEIHGHLHTGDESPIRSTMTSLEANMYSFYRLEKRSRRQTARQSKE